MLLAWQRYSITLLCVLYSSSLRDTPPYMAIGDRQASDSDYDVEHDKVKQKRLCDHVIDAVSLDPEWDSLGLR